ncbi:MAG: ABC transporter substrate-binding protein [Gammaproteobacteria bacterium]|nr:ABC transporter substrate-binding protein [Gammaproteobacteria bacterium]
MLLALALSNAALAADPVKRVVSLDYCADQFVLKLLPPENILALSPDATAHYSYMRQLARGIPQVRPIAEDVLLMQPDLIVRSYGGGPRVAHFFERAGVSILQVPYANDVADIQKNMQLMANALGVPERGHEIVADMQQRLQKLASRPQLRSTLYMTPNGVTAGSGTLIHEMFEAAGLSNFQREAGWRSIPIERLAYEQPDRIATAVFGDNTEQTARWSAMRHPIAQRQVQNKPTVVLEGAWTACGGWFLVDAIEALASQ